MRAACLVILGLAISPALASADEAVLPSGKPSAGTAKLEANGRLTWLSGKQALRLDEVRELKFAPVQLPPLRAAVPFRITLRNGSLITGHLPALDGDTVAIAPVWSDRPLTLPRADLAAIDHLLGWVTFFDDDFEADLKAWKVAGKPTLDARQKTSGKQSLLLDSAGQVAEYSLPTPLSAGRVGINFLASDSAVGATWWVQCEFAGEGPPRNIAVQVAGPEKTYGITVPEPGAKALAVPKTPGWHRLIVEFTAASASVQIDDRLLWSSENQGLGEPLRKVSLICRQDGAAKEKPGEVWFDDFSLARSVAVLPHPPGDPSQDEVWLLNGDQLLGEVLRSDSRQISIKGRFGQRTLAWADVRGLRLRQTAPPRRTSDGEHVRLWIDSGMGSSSDYLEGVVRAFDERQLSLQLADRVVAIDRGRLKYLEGIFFGRRLELQPEAIHLGKGLLPESAAPQPAGISCQHRFQLAVVPDSARLTLSVSHLKGAKDGPAVARALLRGDGRTEVVLNGREVDYLNRLSEKSSPAARPLVVSLPRSLLRVGENVLEIRQALDRQSGDYPDCILSRIMVEIPR